MSNQTQEARFLSAYGKILARHHTHAKIAEILGVNAATVRAWYSRCRVPLKHALAMARRFKSLGVVARDLNEGAV